MPRTYDRGFKLKAVRMATEPGVTAKEVGRRLGPLDKGLIFHSDRGVQYACTDFRDELDTHGFIQSISRREAVGIMSWPSRRHHKNGAGLS